MSEAADAEEVSVREAPAKHRFEIWVGDTLAGFTVYRAGR